MMHDPLLCQITKALVNEGLSSNLFFMKRWPGVGSPKTKRYEGGILPLLVAKASATAAWVLGQTASCQLWVITNPKNGWIAVQTKTFFF